MTMPMRNGATIIELARDIMAVAHPVTGTRATGRVIVKARAGEGTVLLPRNWPLMAIRNNAAREELLYKVGQGPNSARYPNGKRVKHDENEPDAGSWWEVTEEGTLVNVVSIIGGMRHNLPDGTPLVFDPIHPKLEPRAIVSEEGIVNGQDPTWLGGCMSMVQFETMGGASASLDTFRSATGKFPAVVIVWDGSEPADGTTQSSLDRGRTRVGPSSQLWKEKFNLFVLASRMDSDHQRRFEGLKLLDDLAFWLTDATSIDGQQFSVPGGIQIRSRVRIAGDSNAYQQLYVYLLQLSVTGMWRRYDTRTFNDWLRTHNEFLTYEKDVAGDRLVVVSQDIDMTVSSE